MMACFRFLDSVLTKFQKVILDFWWRAQAGEKRAHWIRKDTFFKNKLAGGLGLRNMQAFNMALLANQGWRILQNPDSLISRVLKKKYFLHCELLSAPEKSNTSFVWRSIYSALGILRRGVHFDTSTNRYMCTMGTDGSFTFKCTYQFIEKHSLLDTGIAGPSSNRATEQFWKTFWSLPIPSKVKIFVWKGFNNGLPVGSEMIRRFGLQKFPCSFCNYHNETPIHLFKECWWLRALWNVLQLDPSHLDIPFTCFADWIFYLSLVLSYEDFMKSVIMFWYTLFNRNLRSHGDEGMEIHNTAVHVRLFLSRVHISSSVYNTHAQASYISWKLPPNDYVKINCDGAWRSLDDLAGIGVICRDQHGVVIALQSVALRNIGSCLELEGLALKQGMMIAEKLNLDKVIFETDNTRVAEFLWFGSASTNVSHSSWRLFCIEKFASCPGWSVMLIRREANTIADIAAKYARDTRNSWLSLDACPVFICSSVISAV